MAHSYYWEITLDRYADTSRPAGTNENAVGVRNGDESIANREGVKRSRFQMFDDDRNHIYSGFIYHRNGEEQFAPLDDFGTPNFGCTYMTIDGEIL
jgi:hypothetical protein